MTTYTNPTGTFDATAGDDTIIYDLPPTEPTTVDAGDGSDTLIVQFDPASGPLRVDVSDEFQAGFFDADIRVDPAVPLYVLNFEHAELYGSSSDDSFTLGIGPTSSALTVSMDGGAGQDLLRIIGPTLTTGVNFVVSGTGITSNVGAFSNFEKFWIVSGSGDDTITTGAGDDQVITGTGVDHVSTGAGNDYVEAQSSGGSIDLGDGDDSVDLVLAAHFSALDSLNGGAGQDYLSLSWVNVSAGQSLILQGSTITSSMGGLANFEQFYLSAGSGADTITTGAADDTVGANGGNDTVSAGGGIDWVDGGAGNDQVNGDAGDDTLYGGLGDDTVNGGDGSDAMYGDQNQFSSTKDGADHLDGGAGNDTIYGGGGDDTLSGGGDNDSLIGGAGADHIDGGDGDDLIIGFGDTTGSEGVSFADVLTGGLGNDQIIAGTGDSVDGGSGTDSLDFNAFGATAGISADFSQLTSGGTINVAGATLSGIEYVTRISGSDFSDTIVAGASGGVQGPEIDGWGGDDNLTGSAGVDSVYGGDGNDIIHGGIGIDTGSSPGTDLLHGDAGNDTIYIASDGAYAYGGAGDDTIYGGSAHDEINGDAGADKLLGGAGDDGINGGDGNDAINGGAGHDTLVGGSGADVFTGTAADFNGDTIADFEAGESIVITDANINSFSFSVSGNTLSYSGGSLTFGSDSTFSNLVATAADGGGVQISVRRPPLGTVDQIAQQLTSGFWNGDSHHFNVSQGGTITVNISGLDSTEQNMARRALAEWSDLIGVHFQEVANGGQILFDDSEDPSGPIAATDAVWSNGITTSAHIQISRSWIDLNGSSLASYSFQTYVHEVGHALGLGHAGNYNFTGTFPDQALFLNDAWSMSVMSYFAQDENFYFSNQGFTHAFAVTPMQADIIAAQALYGLSTTARVGNTIYGYHSNAGTIYNAGQYPGVAYTIFDSGGIDTIDYSGSSADQLINLNAESFSNTNGEVGNLSIGRGVVIENAIGGSGSDTLIGNSVANTLTGNNGDDSLTGNGGNDTLDGGAGADTMRGGVGDDTYYIDNAGDAAIEGAAQGTDTVFSSINYRVGDTIENLNLTGSAMRATGNAFANRLVGDSANNILDGREGADIMRGGVGDDSYYVDNSKDSAIESAGEGTDTVFASVNFAIGANIENLNLTGTAVRGSGNSLANRLVGNDANNILDGGAGADVMRGGIGNDSYYVDNAGDNVIENAGEGRERVYTTISLTLGSNLEDLFARGSGAISLTGNSLDNVLRGNSAANVLTGGAGADDLRGGTGGDTFDFNNGDFAGLTPSTSDRIIDFSHAEGDHIDLAGVDANGAAAGDQAFAFIGNAAFSHTAGELRYDIVNGNTYLTGDTNGDGLADFMVRLDGSHALVSGDFVL